MFKVNHCSTKMIVTHMQGQIPKYYRSKKTAVTPSKGVIICLGKVLNQDGTPDPMLLTRCDKAIEIHKETGYPVVNTGSDPVGCGLSEAEVMSDYMIQRQPEMAVFVEDAAMNTVQNFIFSVQIANALQAEEVVIVTCQHHMPRAEYVCRAVLADRKENFIIRTAPSPDTVEGQELRLKEYNKICTTPTYLIKHFNISPPDEEHLVKASKDLEQLLISS